MLREEALREEHSAGKPLLALVLVGSELKVYAFAVQAFVPEAEDAHSEAVTLLDTAQVLPVGAISRTLRAE